MKVVAESERNGAGATGMAELGQIRPPATEGSEQGGAGAMKAVAAWRARREEWRLSESRAGRDARGERG